MPRYAYIAKPGPYRTTKGFIDTETEPEAASRLISMGYFPVSIAAAPEFPAQNRFMRMNRVSKRELALFTSKLSNLLASGINILKALNLIGSQSGNAYFREVIRGVTVDVKDGKTMSESMQKYPRVFSPLYVSMVRSGEAGGGMEPALKRLAEFLEREEKFRSTVSAAMTYPLFILCVSCITVAVLVGFVIPKLAVMFDDMGQLLPLPTRILLAISQGVRSYWWLILLALAALALALRRVLSDASARPAIDRIKLRAAFFGQIELKKEVSRLTRTLALLISGGIAIIQALELSSAVLANAVLKAEVAGCRERINKGESLSACLKQSPWFAGFCADIIAIGEETGTLEKSLLRVAEDYERDTEYSLTMFSKMIEPAVILVMGLVVGFIVISMLLPIFQVNLAAG